MGKQCQSILWVISAYNCAGDHMLNEQVVLAGSRLENRRRLEPELFEFERRLKMFLNSRGIRKVYLSP